MSFTINARKTMVMTVMTGEKVGRIKNCKIANPAPKIRKSPIGCSDPTCEIFIFRGKICNYAILLQTAFKVVR